MFRRHTKIPFYSFLVAGFLLAACGTPTPNPTPNPNPNPNPNPTPKASRVCEADADCLQGYRCQNKQCALCMQCLHIGEKRCTSGNQYALCTNQADGCTTWSAPSACEADKICSVGECIAASKNPDAPCTDVCVQGDKRCVEGIPYHCTKPDKCTAWAKQAECPTGMTCQEGTCAVPTQPPHRQA